MEKLKIYCVTNKKLDFLKNSSYKIGWVSKDESLPNYILCDKGDKPSFSLLLFLKYVDFDIPE